MEVLKTLLTEMNCFSDESIQKMIECFNGGEHRCFWIYFDQTFSNKSKHLLIEAHKLRKELKENGVEILDGSNFDEIIKPNSDKCNIDLFLNILNDVKETMTLNDDIFNEMISSVEDGSIIRLWRVITDKLNCDEKQQIISVIFDKTKNSDQKQYELFVDSYYLDTKRFRIICRYPVNFNLKELKEKMKNNKKIL